jgi:hypothetical protein
MSPAFLGSLLALLPILIEPDDKSAPADKLKSIQEDKRKINEKYSEIYQKAKTGKERENASDGRRNETQRCVQRALQLAKEHAQDPVAFDAYEWIVTGGNGHFPETWQALDQIRGHDLRNPKLGKVCLHARVYRYSYGATEAFLRSVLEENPDPAVRGIATYTLAIVLQDYARVAEALADTKSAKRWEELPQPLKEKLRSSVPEKLRRESEELYQRAADKYGDVKFPSDTRTLASWAESALFELRNLQIGKVAPDIEGEDVDGKRFRLSDYRGKVVLLDFWGHW